MEVKVPKENEDPMVQLDPQAPLDQLDQLDKAENVDRLVMVVILATKDQWDQQDVKVLMVNPVHQAKPVILDHLVLVGQKGLRAKKVSRARLVPAVTEEKEVNQDQQV